MSLPHHWRQNSSQYKAKLCLKAAKLITWTETPAMLLVPAALLLVMEKSRTHSDCLNSAVMKVKTWFYWRGELGKQQLLQ